MNRGENETRVVRDESYWKFGWNEECDSSNGVQEGLSFFFFCHRIQTCLETNENDPDERDSLSILRKGKLIVVIKGVGEKRKWRK